MRRKSIWLLLLLLALAAWSFRDPIEAWTNDIVARHSARNTLASWGLEPSRDNVDLYLASDHSLPLGRNIPADSIGSTKPLEAIPDEIRFSNLWNYGQLFERDRVTIGVYDMDPVVTSRLDRIARDFVRHYAEGVGLRAPAGGCEAGQIDSCRILLKRLSSSYFVSREYK